MATKSYLTTDICDQYSDQISIAQPIFNDYGGVKRFHGPIVTVKVFEDNVLVKETLGRTVEGSVLVIDGGGSHRCALLGDMLAGMAKQNGWAGVLVNGCIRDSAEIADIDVGVKALNTHPLKSTKRGEGQKEIIVSFAGIDFIPGHYLYADEDGLIVSPQKIELSK